MGNAIAQAAAGREITPSVADKIPAAVREERERLRREYDKRAQAEAERLRNEHAQSEERLRREEPLAGMQEEIAHAERE
eukprot:gene13401-10398_t